MPWQLAIGISVILSSVSAILQRTLLKKNKSDPVSYSAIFQTLCGLMILFFGFLTAPIGLPVNLFALTPNLIFAVVLYSLGNVFIFKALKEGQVSNFTILFAARGLISVFASAILLHEFLKLNQLAGAALVLAAIVVVNLNRSLLRVSRASLFALSAAVCFGLANTNDRLILKSFELYTYVALAFIAPGIVLFFSRPAKIVETLKIASTPVFRAIVVLSLIYSAGAVAFFIALSSKQANSSQVVMVGLTSVITTVFLSAIFLKERDHIIKKIIAVSLTFIGILLLS